MKTKYLTILNERHHRTAWRDELKAKGAFFLHLYETIRAKYVVSK
jgi:hypothetical protein